MNTQTARKLSTQLEEGKVYRRESLSRFSKSVDRDLLILVASGKLEKVAPGMYVKPRQSRFGALPPEDRELVQQFLKDDRYLLYSWNDYNSLGLGLTQLYMHTVVYNYKRHGKFKLAGKAFDFRRPTNGFPKVLTQEFLLVDLVNNLKYLAESSSAVKAAIKRNFKKFDADKVEQLANLYGKVATKKFFKELAV
jgi:hypothetical protein